MREPKRARILVAEKEPHEVGRLGVRDAQLLVVVGEPAVEIGERKHRLAERGVPERVHPRRPVLAGLAHREALVEPERDVIPLRRVVERHVNELVPEYLAEVRGLGRPRLTKRDEHEVKRRVGHPDGVGRWREIGWCEPRHVLGRPGDAHLDSIEDGLPERRGQLGPERLRVLDEG